MGCIVPVPPYPLAAAASCTLTPQQVAALAGQLGEVERIDASADPEFHACVDYARRGTKPADARVAADAMQQEAESIAELLRDTASRGLGLDVHHHPRP